MKASLFVRELRRSTGLSLLLPTLILLGLVPFVACLPGPLPFAQGPDALVEGSAGAIAHDYAYVAEVLLAAAAALPALVVSSDVGDRSRGLILTYPVGTVRFTAVRLAVALAWCIFWSIAVLALAEVIGVHLPWVRDLALLMPEEAFVLAGVFATTEWTREPGLGTGFAALALVFGYGIRGLPFAEPLATNFELVGAHNHPLSAALWLNRLVMLALAVLLAAAGAAGLSFHRRSGGYAGS
jgi:hypothetical protein